MQKKLLYLFCLFSSFSLLSQESVLVKGKIVADSLDNSFINIVNMTQKTGTVNTPTGEFEIEVYENDTLFFSSVQYELEEIIITQNIIDTGILEVQLIENVNQLEEVNISDLNLTGNLNTDIGDISVFNQADIGFAFSDKAKLSSVERKLYTASSGSVDLLLNTLNGRIKMLKKAKANDELDQLVQKGIEALALSIFVEEFAIPEEHVENFVYFCAEDSDFKALLNREQPLELLEWYRSKVTYYLNYRMNL